MLQSLYEYAQRHQLTLPPGYVNKTVKAWIWLRSDDSTFVDVLPGDDTLIPCPDVGSMANSRDKSNVIVEKRSVILPVEPSAKHQFFLKSLYAAEEQEPIATVCAAALENPAVAEKVGKELDRLKIKDSDRISFRVDSTYLPQSEHVKAWWQTYRQQYQDKNGELMRCLITGELTEPMATTPAIKGLHSVGGHASGDALICFDKNAFCSYGKKQAANAPVSEDAYSAVKSALDDLLARAPVLAGMKFVHWYDADIPTEEDPLPSLFDSEADEDAPEEKSEAEWQQKEWDAKQAADRVIRSVKTGEAVVSLPNRYYILMLTGVGGRVMIRRYEQGSYEELVERLHDWDSDMSLINSAGTAELLPCKLVARLMRLMKYQKTDTRPFDRLSKELSGIAPAVISAILTGAPLPDSVAARALAYIRSRMLASADGTETNSADLQPDARACQWLKVWLLRKNNRTREWLMSTYSENAYSTAYYCGAVMAVYAAIQQRAMHDVNATVTQRYYGAAIQTPAMVLGQLSRMSIHHLEKMDGGLASIFNKYLEDLSVKIQGKIPATLSLEGQSEFALGYYQMSAKMKQDINERRNARKEKEEQKK